MSVLTVVGARPQFIKAAVTSHALASIGVEEHIVHTGQHFDADMSETFFTELQIPEPIIKFDVRESQHGAQTAKMMLNLEPLMVENRPDVVLVYGDTNSTLAGALTASKLHIPIFHVESGLRSFNRKMPEEINRLVTDRISSRLYVPSKAAESQLISEGVDESMILNVGDVMYDIFKLTAKKITSQPSAKKTLPGETKQRLLLTAHRAENVDNAIKLQILVDAILKVSGEFDIIWPVHPRTLSRLKEFDLLSSLRDSSVDVKSPLGYGELVSELMRSDLVCTDSGGLQKEAFFAQIPCVVVREETEWTELIEGGWNTLVPLSDTETVVSALRVGVGRVGSSIQPYGDGTAALAIARDINEFLSSSDP